MTKQSTRDQIVATADDLFYKKGFEATSFADIAKYVGISRGNFYHHFKSKDAILNAVIDLRLSNTQAMLKSWENEGERPAERIRAFVNILIANRAKIMLYGCPVGTLCAELIKLEHQASNRVSDVFAMFQKWLARQFEALGCAEADVLAMHLLARSQGIATLASAFRNEAFVRREVDELNAWLEQIAPGASSKKRR